MTSAGPMTTAIEQVFLHRPADGSVEMVASSLDDAQVESAWTSPLGEHVDPGPTADRPPAHAFSYFVLPSGPAVLLRRTWPQPGRPAVDAHGLVGPPAQLSPQVALAASTWSGWRGEPPGDPRMDVLRPEDIEVRDAADGLRAHALGQGDLLARSLAWLLQSPTTPLGLLGCPEEDRIALVWGLLEIGGPLLARPWTFSTHEDPTRDDRHAALAFLAGDRMPPAGRRITVDLRRDQGASPQNEYRANALVYRYEFGADPPAPAAAAPPRAPAPVPAAPLPPRTSPTGPSRQDPRPPRSLDRLAEHVRRLVDAEDGRAVDRALVELEYAVHDHDDRDDVRAALEDVDWAIPTVELHVPFDRRPAAYDRIVGVAFGCSDSGHPTDGAVADARRVAASCDSDELVHALARADEEADLATALARRWLRQHRPVEPDPGAGLGPVGRFLLARDRPITPERERLVVAGLLLLALLVSFLLGMLVQGVVG